MGNNRKTMSLSYIWSREYLLGGWPLRKLQILRRLWLSETRCRTSFPENFDGTRQFPPKTKNTYKQSFHGIVAGFPGNFVYVFFSPKGHHPRRRMNKILTPTQSRDNPRALFMFLRFFFFLKVVLTHAPPRPRLKIRTET